MSEWSPVTEPDSFDGSAGLPRRPRPRRHEMVRVTATVIVRVDHPDGTETRVSDTVVERCENPAQVWSMSELSAVGALRTVLARLAAPNRPDLMRLFQTNGKKS